MGPSGPIFITMGGTVLGGTAYTVRTGYVGDTHRVLMSIDGI